MIICFEQEALGNKRTIRYALNIIWLKYNIGSDFVFKIMEVEEYTHIEQLRSANEGDFCHYLATHFWNRDIGSGAANSSPISLDLN